MSTDNSTAVSSTQKCFLVCNAHLDPVWLWPWEEGLTEAISTFRVAADFCDKYPDFIFSHNEALLYEWVERNDPALFVRIQELVKKGRWCLVGGAYLQPDMIAAGGEPMIRQYLVGRRYFQEKFQVSPTVSWNFDSFGHPQGMIQILAGCGVEAYVFCRPGRDVLPLPVGTFSWRHASGVEILGRRSDEHYITQGGLFEKMRDKDWAEHFRSEGDFMYQWGIGNHGGGPSHAEYAGLQKLQAAHPELEIIESDPEAFFKHTLAVRDAGKIPVVEGDFVPVQEGCYTSMYTVKSRHRKMENLISIVESAAAIAWWRGQREYPCADLTVAWKDILFSEFHDVLPGSGIERVEKDSLNLLGHAEEILRRKRAEILISRLYAEPLAERNETPIFVFNPHGWEVTQEVEIDFGLDRQFSMDQAVRRLLCDGKEVVAQFERGEDNLLNDSWGEWRARAVFKTTIPAYSYKRFETGYDVLPKPEVIRWRTPALPESDTLTIDTEQLRVVIGLKTGLLERVDCNGVPVLTAATGQPIVLADITHSWSTVPEWKEPVGKFELATPERAMAIIGSQWSHQKFTGKPPISIIEDGPVRTVVETIWTYGASYIVQRYIISKTLPTVQIEQVVFWAEHDRRLCVEINHASELCALQTEKCYSIDEEEALSASGFESPYQRFIRLSGKQQNQAFAVVSHGTHGYSHQGDKLRLSLLRSPGYATHDHNIPVEFDRYLNRYSPRQDQGISNLKFTLLFGEKAASTDATARAAWEANAPLDPFIYFPTSRNPAPNRAPFADVDKENVLTVALKKAEGADALIFRFWETKGADTAFQLTVEGKTYPLTIGAWTLKTVRLTRDGTLTETNLIEQPL